MALFKTKSSKESLFADRVSILLNRRLYLFFLAICRYLVSENDNLMGEP